MSGTQRKTYPRNNRAEARLSEAKINPKYTSNSRAVFYPPNFTQKIWQVINI